MADLTQEEWTKRYEADENAVLIDVRSEGEYNQGHIPNTILIDIWYYYKLYDYKLFTFK